MHRIILRVVGKCISEYSRNLTKDRSRVRRIATRNTHGCQTFSRSQAYHYIQPQLGTENIQLQIVNALRLGERERASDILLNLGSLNHSLGPDDFAYVLDYCAHSPDLHFSMETWRLMVEKSVPMDERCYRAIIKAFCKGGRYKEALDWLASASEHDFENALLPLYNNFLTECVKRDNFIAIGKCMELMESQHVGKSERTYQRLLKVAVSRKDLPAVQKIWKDCTMNYSPSILALKQFVWSFSSLGDIESANSILQHMRTLAFQENASFKNSSAGSQYSRIDIPIPLRSELTNSILGSVGINTQGGFTKMKPEIKEKHNEDRGELKENVSYSMKKLLSEAYSNVVHACARARNCELAEFLFMQMLDIGLELPGVTYDAIVIATLCGKEAIYAIKVIKSIEEWNIKPYSDSLAALSIVYSKILELDMAENLLEKIVPSGSPKFIYHINAFLGACDIMNQPERAIRMLAKLKHANIKLNIRTYEHLYSLFGVVNYPYMYGNPLSHQDVAQRINAIEEDMVRNGVEHSYRSIKILVRSLGSEDMLHYMLQYLSRAESMFINMDIHEVVDIYNVALHALVKGNESALAIELFEYMRQGGFPLSQYTYTIMMQCCSKLPCFKSASALLCVMLCAGFVPQLPQYTLLIATLMADNDFEQAATLLDQAISCVEVDIRLVNAVLEPMWKGKIGLTEKMVELMHRKKIRPDSSTCCFTVQAYAYAGLDETALEALRVMSLRMISEDDKILEEHKRKYKDLIYSEEPDAESKIFEIFANNECLACALLGLRWYAMVSGSDISWCPNESPWAKRLSSSFDLQLVNGLKENIYKQGEETNM